MLRSERSGETSLRSPHRGFWISEHSHYSSLLAAHRAGVLAIVERRGLRAPRVLPQDPHAGELLVLLAPTTSQFDIAGAAKELSDLTGASLVVVPRSVGAWTRYRSRRSGVVTSPRGIWMGEPPN